MITRSKLVEQLRDYQIRSQHKKHIEFDPAYIEVHEQHPKLA